LSFPTLGPSSALPLEPASPIPCCADPIPLELFFAGLSLFAALLPEPASPILSHAVPTPVARSVRVVQAPLGRVPRLVSHGPASIFVAWRPPLPPPGGAVPAPAPA